MQGKQHSKLHNFVHGRDENEDLKASLPADPVPGTGYPLRGNGQTMKSSTQIKQEKDTEQQKPSVQCHFYDTDAESMGQTSTTASLRQKSVMRPAESDNQDEVDDPDERQGSVSGEDDESEHEQSEDLPENPALKHAAVRELDREVRSGGFFMLRGTGLPPQKGDSYPTTTSGNPSIADLHNTGAQRNFDREFKYNPNAPGLLSRPASHRQSYTVQQHQTQANTTVPAPSRAAPAQPVRQAASNPAGAYNAVPAGFAFAPAPTAHQKTQSPRSVRAPSTNTAQPASVPRNGDEHRFVPPMQPQQPVQKYQTLENLPHHVKGTPKHQSVHHTAGGQDIVSVPTRDEKTVQHDGHEAGHEQSLHPRNDDHESEQDMDYEFTELRVMDYHTLKSETFDAGPNAKQFKLAGGKEDDTLSDVIQTVSRLQPVDQARFFSSLTIEQWEQAGDWLLDQFSSVVGKLKTVRQEKRKAARAFEDEIEDRFETVGQKRKQIDGALAEMRETGGKVLQGTPKKKKTK